MYINSIIFFANNLVLHITLGLEVNTGYKPGQLYIGLNVSLASKLILYCIIIK